MIAVADFCPLVDTHRWWLPTQWWLPSILSWCQNKKPSSPPTLLKLGNALYFLSSALFPSPLLWLDNASFHFQCCLFPNSFLFLSVLFSQHLGKTNLCIAKTKATKKREKTSLCFLFIVLSVDKTKKKSQLFLPFLFSVTAEVSTVPSSELLCSHYWSQSCTFMAAGSKTCCQGDPWRRGGDTQKEEPQRRVLHVL